MPYVKVKASKTKIAKAAGIDARWINNAFKELMHMLLVKPKKYDQEKQLPKGEEWVVYVVPVYSPAVKNEEIFEADEDLNPIKYDTEFGGSDDLERRHSKSDKRHSKLKKRHFDSKKRHFVTESSLISSLRISSLKPEKEEDSHSFHSLESSSYETGLQEEQSIGDQESSPGEPGALTSRPGASLGSPEAPVRDGPCFDCCFAEPDGLGGMDCTVSESLSKHDCYEKWKEWNKDATSSEQIKERIITDWNKRDCKQCRYRGSDDDATEYCTMAFSDQEASIGEMEYCPLDREKIPFQCTS